MIDRKNRCFIDNDSKLKCPVFSEPRKVYTEDDVRIRHDRKKTSLLGITRNGDPVSMTRSAVEKIGGMCKYVKKDDLVAIKINITGGVSTNKASYTNPDVVKSVVSMVKECGGKPFVYDSSMIWTDLEPIAKKQGWYAWAKKNGINLVDIHNMPVVPFDFGDDGVIKYDKASRPLIDADVLINIPKMKTHLLTTHTIGLKNNYGSLPRADKGVYHAKDIDSVIADINKAFPSTLTIVDGTIAGEGESGPLTPDPIMDYNTIFASNDVVCADSVSSIFMGFKNPMSIRHVKLSHYVGVGDAKCYKKDNVSKEIKENFGKHPKDGNFTLPDPNVIETVSDMTKLIARNAGGTSLFNSFADGFLGNMSYYTTSMMNWMLKTYTRFQKRYIGRDMPIRKNVHGLNLHPEDDLDSVF